MKADKKVILKLLNNPNITMYQVFISTGIPQTTLSDLRTGKTDIDLIQFKTAALLTAYGLEIEKAERLHSETKE